MNPTRIKPDAGTNGIIKTRQKLLLIAGALFTIAGLASLVSELWRGFWKLTPFSWSRVGVALGICGIGLVLIQTLNPLKIVEVIEEFAKSRIPGGRRWSDPPPETAPPRLPEDQWPKPSAEWRSGKSPERARRRDD